MSNGTGKPIGAILAGGLGRRIGGAKAVVQLCGRPLISYPLEAMQAVLPEVVVVAKADTKLPSLRGVTLWVESDPRPHPLVGLHEALSLASGRSVIVCAGDLPFVTAELIGELAAAELGDAPAVITRCRDVIQPLLGLYTAAAAPRLAAGEGRVLDAVAALGPRYLEVADPQLLFNVNAPEDLLRAAAVLDASRT
jgi:molybdopterin-guanine dinucleotide biosynthesis protein A